MCEKLLYSFILLFFFVFFYRIDTSVVFILICTSFDLFLFLSTSFFFTFPNPTSFFFSILLLISHVSIPSYHLHLHLQLIIFVHKYSSVILFSLSPFLLNHSTFLLSVILVCFSLRFQGIRNVVLIVFYFLFLLFINNLFTLSLQYLNY